MAQQELSILVRRVLWGAMEVSIAVMGIAVPWLMPAGIGDQTGLTLPMLAASLGCAGAAIFLARRGDPTLWIVALSLAEVPAVLGLVAHLVGAGSPLPLVVTAFVAWALAAPREATGSAGARASVDVPPPLA